MPAAIMLHQTDPKEDLIAKIGSLDGIDLLHNQVLVAVYMQPEKTAGGIIRPDVNRDEDRHQSKVGLILKAGDKAFTPDDEWSWPDGLGIGDWVFFRVSDGWNVTLNGDRNNLCRILNDTQIRGRVQHPDQVW